MSDDLLTSARRALDDSDAVVDRLHKMCCQPDRSPRMIAVKETIASIRTELDASNDDPAAFQRALENLMDVGGQIGYLQVGCCAPARMPLYADVLQHLRSAQADIKKSVGKGHDDH